MKPVYLRPECKGEDIQWLHDILKARHSDTGTKGTAEEGSVCGRRLWRMEDPR
jgi:hypothetical protein